MTEVVDAHSEYCGSHGVGGRCLSSRQFAKYLESSSGKVNSAEDVRTFLNKQNIPGAAQLNCRKLQNIKRFHDEMQLEEFQESFSYLQSQVGILLEANPGSIADVQCIEIPNAAGISTQRFYRMFFVLRSDIEVAMQCKPIISFDAGALKLAAWSKYQVLVCGMQDGEGRDCSVGFAVVPTEDEMNYTYFLEGMKSDNDLKRVLEQEGLLVITDRDKGLMNAIAKGLPQAHHRWCSLHLFGNIPPPAFTHVERELYWKIVKCSTESEFRELMSALRSLHKPAYDYLSKLAPEHWTTWASPVPTWGLTTNNLSERAVKYIGSDIDLGRKSTMVSLVVEYTKKVRI